MLKQSISFVQVNFQTGPERFKNFYLPYTVGMLISYAWANPVVADTWAVDQIVWRRDDVETIAQRLKNNHTVAISVYVWSRKYSYTLAQRLKELNPAIRIILGGPEVEITDSNLFVKLPFVDIVVKLEGEKIFRQLLEGQDPKTVAGLLINDSGKIIDTGDGERIDDLDALPSPYLTGVFDQLIADNPDVNWTATLETNRGCPYQCTFCDWGGLTYSKVKKFDLDRVFAEIEWMAKHCAYVSVTDANFGIFPERDNLIIDKILEVQRQYNSFDGITMTWAKNQKAVIVDMVKKLSTDPKLAHGLTISTQSMDQDVLKNIKRQNMDENKVEEIFKLCEQRGISAYTETIMGLPGETSESWKEGMYQLFRLGNHNSIMFYQAQLIENAEMNLLQRKLYKLESAPVYDSFAGSREDAALPEVLNMVVSTSTINREQMLDLMTWNAFIYAFHVSGITTYLSRFLKKYAGVDYSEFYGKLHDFVLTDAWISGELDITRQYYKNWISQGRVGHPDIGTVVIAGWNLYHRLILQIHAQQKMSHINGLVEQFVHQNFVLPDDMAEQLVEFQQQAFLTYDNVTRMPYAKTYSYDFYGYLVDEQELMNSVRYDYDTYQPLDNLTAFAFMENLYYGRKKNFNKVKISRTLDASR